MTSNAKVAAAAVIACLLLALCGGCRDRSTSDGHAGEAETPADQGVKQAIDAYIVRMSPLLRQHGFPGVTMTPSYPGGVWKIRVIGEVVSTSERGESDNRMVLESVIHASKPPAETVMEVKYQVRRGGAAL